MIVVPPTGDEVQKKPNIIDGLSVLVKALHTFDQLAYAVDQSLGNLTVNPKNLGTALKLEATIKGAKAGDEQKQILRDDHFILTEQVSEGLKLQTFATLAQEYNEMV